MKELKKQSYILEDGNIYHVEVKVNKVSDDIDNYEQQKLYDHYKNEIASGYIFYGNSDMDSLGSKVEALAKSKLECFVGEKAFNADGAENNASKAVFVKPMPLHRLKVLRRCLYFFPKEMKS